MREHTPSIKVEHAACAVAIIHAGTQAKLQGSASTPTMKIAGGGCSPQKTGAKHSPCFCNNRMPEQALTRTDRMFSAASGQSTPVASMTACRSGEKRPLCSVSLKRCENTLAINYHDRLGTNARKSHSIETNRVPRTGSLGPVQYTCRLLS